MQLFDISQEVFSCAVFPGDPSPKKTAVLQMAKGDIVNLTHFSMCAHNGTHLDAPLHFFAEGEGVDRIPLEKTVGRCFVTEQTGEVSEKDAREILHAALRLDSDCAKRILIKGPAVVTPEAARFFAEAEIFLLGVESQTVGPENAPMAVHLTLLSKKVVLLEGLRLSQVPQGRYLLSAAPLNLAGCDGAPCRAVLMAD